MQLGIQQVSKGEEQIQPLEVLTPCNPPQKGGQPVIQARLQGVIREIRPALVGTPVPQ